MARGRLITRTLGSSSRKFSALAVDLGPLGEFAQALYPLIVANTDDHGRYDGDAFTVKHAVFSTSPRLEREFEEAMLGMERVGLIVRYEVADRMVLEIVDFAPHQPGLHKRRVSRYPDSPGNAGNFPAVPDDSRLEGEEEGKPEEEVGREEEPPRVGPISLMAVWNEHRGELAEATRLTADRERHAKARLREHPDLSWWAPVVKRMASSAFCRGEVSDRVWRADFDFLLKPGTAEKVLEGKYDGRAGLKRNERVTTWSRSDESPDGLCPDCGNPGGRCSHLNECNMRAARRAVAQKSKVPA